MAAGPSRRILPAMGGPFFLIVAVGAWLAFGFVLATRPVLLDQMWGAVRSLSSAAKPLVWIAFLPWIRPGRLGEQLAHAPGPPDPRRADGGRVDRVLVGEHRRARRRKVIAG
jgi:hypothetical protein